MAGVSPHVRSEAGPAAARESAALGSRDGSSHARQPGGLRGGATAAGDVMRLSATLIRGSKFYTLHRAIEDAIRAMVAYYGVADADANHPVTPDLVDALLSTRGFDHMESVPQVVSLLPYACERLDMVDVAFSWYSWIVASAIMRRALPDAAVRAVFKRYAAFLVGVMDDVSHAQAAVAAGADAATLPSRRDRALSVCATAQEAGVPGMGAVTARARALEEVPVEEALQRGTAQAILGPLSPRLANHAASVDLGREDLEDAVAADPGNALLWWRLALVLEEARDHIGALTALDECGSAIRVLSRSAMEEDTARLDAFRRLCPLFLPPLLAARICATHLGRTEDALRHAAAARAVAEEEVEEARVEAAAAAQGGSAEGGTPSHPAPLAPDPGKLFHEDLRLPRPASATLGCVAACVALASVEVVRAREQATHAERVALALRAQAALADAEALLGTEGTPPSPPHRSRSHRRVSDAAPSPSPAPRSELERRIRRHLRSAVHFVQAQCAAERGQLTEASQLVRELSAIMPAQFEPRAAMLHALVLSAQRDPAEALRACRAALQHNCDDVGLLWAEAALVSRTEGPTTGLRLFKEALTQARERLAVQAKDDSPAISCLVVEPRDGPRDRMLRPTPMEAVERAGTTVDTPLGAVPPSLPLRTWFSVMPPLGARTTQREARAQLVRVACSTVRTMLTVERGARAREALELLEVLRAEAEVAADPALRADIEHHNALCLAAQDRGQAAYSALHTALAFDAWHVPTLVALGKHHYALALTPLHEDPGQGVVRAILLARASGDEGVEGAEPALRPKVARARELDKAQSYLALAVRADNDNYEARHKLGLVRNAQGDVERASTALFSALEKEDAAPLLPFSAVPARV